MHFSIFTCSHVHVEHFRLFKTTVLQSKYSLHKLHGKKKTILKPLTQRRRD